MQGTFKSASLVYMEDPKAFKPQPHESLLKPADRFDEVAMPLLLADIMTLRKLNSRDTQPYISNELIL